MTAPTAATRSGAPSSATQAMMRTMARNMSAWLLLSLALGCSAEKTEALPKHHVWAGWNHSWSKLCHRVSFIRAIATAEGGLELGIRGGDWSTGDTWADDTAYRMHLQEVSASDLYVTHGETMMTVGPDGITTQEEEAEVQGDAFAVVLRGFEIETDIEQDIDYPDYDPALGYTSRGFGMSVGNTDRDGDTVAFDVTAQVRWGPRDRDDMNEAMLQANTGVRVAWTVIGYSGDLSTASATDGIDLLHDPPYSEQSGLSMPVDLPTAPGLIGIAGFDLQVRDQDGGDGGDYLRSFGVEAPLSDGSHAPEEVLAEVTTTSAVELGEMHFSPTVDLLWLHIDKK